MPKRDSEFKNPEIGRTTAETKTNWKRSVKAAIIAFESASVSLKNVWPVKIEEREK